MAARRRMQETTEISSDRTRQLPPGRLPSTNGGRVNFEPEPTRKWEVSSQSCLTPSLPSTVCDRTLAPCTGSAANSTKTRRKSLARRLVESVRQQEVRQHGYVYQKNRKQSDKWIPTERAYGRYRVDVPGNCGSASVPRQLSRSRPDG